MGNALHCYDPLDRHLYILLFSKCTTINFLCANYIYALASLSLRLSSMDSHVPLRRVLKWKLKWNSKKTNGVLFMLTFFKLPSVHWRIDIGLWMSGISTTVYYYGLIQVLRRSFLYLWSEYPPSRPSMQALAIFYWTILWSCAEWCRAQHTVYMEAIAGGR